MLYQVKNKIPLYQCTLPIKKNGHYGLYGGSFNPVHEGHKAVVGYAYQALGLDGVIILVTPQNPFKDKSIYTDYEGRLSEVREKISCPKYHISDFEKKISMQFSFETIYMLTKRYPDVRFTFIMGSDSVEHLHRWHFFKEIIKRVNLGIIIRHTQRYQINQLPAIRMMRQYGTSFKFILKPYKKISSTALRALR